MSEDLNQVMRIRREKLDLLRARGILPFGYRFDRTHRMEEAARLFEEEEGAGTLDEKAHGSAVRVGGRLKSFRGHGKSAFGHLEDGSAGLLKLFWKAIFRSS